ncbi:hypothetical protein E2C01_002157 [Portunus trituberculatus]|uniref:Uncharacterized protein n=1 Tax=Portunus trituberculatus TaxID=210409 RepID=A0A5B7CLF9_PORTR|nr:hypothetical protein [Portunus trituberculatus]
METGDVRDGKGDRCVKEAGRGDGLDNTFLAHSSQPQTRSLSSFTAESHENLIVVTAGEALPTGGRGHHHVPFPSSLPPSPPFLCITRQESCRGAYDLGRILIR